MSITFCTVSDEKKTISLKSTALRLKSLDVMPPDGPNDHVQSWNRAGPGRACVSIGVEQNESELSSFSVY